ncbi:Possible membrane protein [[Actinomadura] parvosata subsp. kistnae]|uniref:DUF58 domain-containing protein n=1 Tax=[Actinomadura] parvosata subsp. kistnae TaxID=1909395 RepID=A0A1V0A8Q4_9ACTN|nr:DUF58 domain-containing protein [Nonomuraea sp. ATCC 55076]AQZ66587.1 hypothetical protein BKM31_38645 [Nonomuraea sp. ATCC 55076]SPL95333.1 Possible membrane protein [Actinomadura parvosata subsp. kistnae]
MALTGRAGLVAAVGIVVVLFAPQPGAALAGVCLLLAAAIVVDLVFAGAVQPLRFHRSGDTLVRLGQQATIELVVENPGRRRVRGLLRDAWPPSAGVHPRVAELDVPAGERRKIIVTLTPTRRGDRSSVAITVRSRGPLGLAARQGNHQAPWTVRVLPPFLSRKHLPSRLARLRELDGQHPALVRGQGTEFDSLREYVVGDDVRSIDWRATARRHDVVVRTWRPERDRRVLIVLDTGRTSAGRVGAAPIPMAGAEAGGGLFLRPDPRPAPGWPRLDWSMDAALLLAALAARAGDQVDFLAHDRAVRAWVSGASRTELLSSLVNVMAPIEAELVEADSQGMVAAILSRAKRRCLVVLLTDLNPAAMDEGLMPVLPQLSSRHLVLVAGVSDPSVAAMSGRRGSADEVYDAAAAEQAQLGRRRITARLRRHGVEVVDAPPDDIAPALADAYLALKAAGRL